jgi:cellulose synthase/poly-beta-1,6-N-acetylglucosamine synthase-like glycosyltransferase
MIELLIAIVVASLGVFMGFYLFYFTICLSSVKAQHKKIPDERTGDDVPMVSIIVPVYNESKVMSAKIDNLEKSNYPKNRVEMIFVDGGSTDGSVETLEDRIKGSNMLIKIVKQGSRKGFNSAVIEGFSKSIGDIIFITGAETEYEPRTLDVVVKHFENPSVGAVTGRQIIKNVGEGYSPQLESAYRGLYDFVREAEGHIDSPFDLKGEISAARRKIVESLVMNPKLSRKGCIDACFSFQGKIDGYRTVYEPSAVYYEHTTTHIKDSFKQQIRRGATLIENMLAFKMIFFRRKYGAFGMLIFPAHFLMLLVLPYLFLIGSVGLLALAALSFSNYVLLSVVSVCILCVFLVKRVQAFVKTQLVLILATLKLFRGVETQKFERLESVRPRN